MKDIVQASILASTGGGDHNGLGWYIFVYSGIVMASILLFAMFSRRDMGKPIPKNIFTKLAEHLYVFVENMCLSIIGSHGRKYISFVMSLWLIIFTCNVFGLILPHTPTAELSLNLSLSIITMLYVQWEGIKTHGFLGHIKHFAGPKLAWFLAMFITPILFTIELVSEFMKVLSLALRLYSNIEGGHKVVHTLNDLVMDGRWPVGGVLIVIKFLSCVIQALVFTILTCVYLSIVTHKHSNEKEGNENLSDSGKKKAVKA